MKGNDIESRETKIKENARKIEKNIKKNGNQENNIETRREITIKENKRERGKKKTTQLKKQEGN